MKTVKLPSSLTALKKLPLPERFALFKRWLTSRPPETPYDFMSNHGCALAQFGAAIRGGKAWGWSTSIATSRKTPLHYDERFTVEILDNRGPHRFTLQKHRTFGALAQALS